MDEVLRAEGGGQQLIERVAGPQPVETGRENRRAGAGEFADALAAGAAGE
jgi:hypothetical protein